MNPSLSTCDFLLIAAIVHIAGDELSDTEDPDLLAELQGLQGDSGPATPSSSRGGGRHPIRQEDEDGVGHSLLQTIKDRIALYREAEQVATAQGEGGKARRAARGLRTLQVSEFSVAKRGVHLLPKAKIPLMI